ncbi:Crp/Fnr family transcriptional regulator [Magnetospirillum aberrantis]|uniref:Crp/Fnr family transcriptional regulator n=1 Tax=Magnetospirillum aberrantis SpK TaxID=908842 RepID=A0A7C9QU57_9PROT|nr:Crp/Fnr family transcriptional regulator [Magnetospirillum aberrantis]NFV80644.1 Crp/Fnr family transcriptional regulator [Magnetospirillum aberrantis SpK]
MNHMCSSDRTRSECLRCDIRKAVLFAELTPDDIARMFLPVSQVVAEVGDSLFEEGDCGGAIYTIREGVVKLVQYQPDGGQRIVRLLGAGSTIGLEALVDQPYEHHAIALQDVRACRIPVEEVHRLCVETPRLYRQLMRRWHDSIRLADEWLTNMSTGSARTRLARLFLYLTQDGRHQRCGLFRREDLGAMLGISTETASRMVADFKRTGTIRQLRRNMYECDVNGLRAIASDGP